MTKAKTGAKVNGGRKVTKVGKKEIIGTFPDKVKNDHLGGYKDPKLAKVASEYNKTPPRHNRKRATLLLQYLELLPKEIRPMRFYSSGAGREFDEKIHIYNKTPRLNTKRAEIWNRFHELESEELWD